MRRQSNVLAATALATAITAVTVSDCRPIPPSIRRSKCGRDTMTQDDIDNGRLICEIGIAPVKPAEFVIFRIQQKLIDQTQP